MGAQDIKSLPTSLIEELADCAFADEAETVFNDWADLCYIEPKDRAHVWLTAEA